jgi:hypothetical protein
MAQNVTMNPAAAAADPPEGGHKEEDEEAPLIADQLRRQATHIWAQLVTSPTNLHQATAHYAVVGEGLPLPTRSAFLAASFLLVALQIGAVTALMAVVNSPTCSILPNAPGTCPAGNWCEATRGLCAHCGRWGLKSATTSTTFAEIIATDGVHVCHVSDASNEVRGARIRQPLRLRAP